MTDVMTWRDPRRGKHHLSQDGQQTLCLRSIPGFWEVDTRQAWAPEDCCQVCERLLQPSVYGALARAEALAAGDPDWMNVTRWPTPPARYPSAAESSPTEEPT